MKKFIIIVAVSIFFCSCGVKFVNSYTVSRIEHDGQDYTTIINTEADYSRGQLIEINGQSFKVIFTNSTEIK